MIHANSYKGSDHCRNDFLILHVSVIEDGGRFLYTAVIFYFTRIDTRVLTGNYSINDAIFGGSVNWFLTMVVILSKSSPFQMMRMFIFRVFDREISLTNRDSNAQGNVHP